MKNIILLIFSLCCITSLMAQENNDPLTPEKDVYNDIYEVKLSTVKLLSLGIVETSLEYVFDSNMGVGAYLLVNFDKAKDQDYLEKFSITPYFRMYFQNKEDFGAKGMFVEPFVSFFTSNYDNTDTSSKVITKSVFDVAPGLAIGKKWLNKAGFVFEIKGGIGRTILGNADFKVLPKGDVYIGYRFK